eukprot:TRINITY_DN3515_c0_g1_i3.p2 TRINITY_DN3515_c0_g1~~TRINITY_DN3515_c0_g1_i3.p2  ORF type:complete len:402 (-),score=67.45 TRINITY_DN3515_c0_g1_i3:127-1332(-)
MFVDDRENMATSGLLRQCPLLSDKTAADEDIPLKTIRSYPIPANFSSASSMCEGCDCTIELAQPCSCWGTEHFFHTKCYRCTMCGVLLEGDAACAVSMASLQSILTEQRERLTLLCATCAAESHEQLTPEPSDSKQGGGKSAKMLKLALPHKSGSDSSIPSPRVGRSSSQLIASKLHALSGVRKKIRDRDKDRDKELGTPSSDDSPLEDIPPRSTTTPTTTPAKPHHSHAISALSASFSIERPQQPAPQPLTPPQTPRQPDTPQTPRSRPPVPSVQPPPAPPAKLTASPPLADVPTMSNSAPLLPSDTTQHTHSWLSCARADAQRNAQQCTDNSAEEHATPAAITIATAAATAASIPTSEASNGEKDSAVVVPVVPTVVILPQVRTTSRPSPHKPLPPPPR